VRRVVREDPLDANAVRDLADGERRSRSLRDPADAHALERLQARLLTLADLRPHLDRIAGAELRQLSLATLALVDGVDYPLRAADHKMTPAKRPTGRGVLPEISGTRQAARPKSRSRRIAAAERTERWFQSEAPSIGASTRDTDGISESARPHPVPS